MEAAVEVGLFAGLLAMGWWFWIVTAIVIGCLCWSMNDDNVFWATVCIVGYVVVQQFLLKNNIFGYVKANPGTILMYFGIYAGMGVTWSFFKWNRVVTRQKDRYEEAKIEWLTRNDVENPHKGVIPGDLKSKWKEHCADNYDLDKIAKPPLAKDNKAKITNWMGYWPFSLLWYLIEDLFVEIWNGFFRFFQSLFQKISDARYASVRSDFE